MAANPLFQTYSYKGRAPFIPDFLHGDTSVVNHSHTTYTFSSGISSSALMAQRSDRRGKRGGPQKDSEGEKNQPPKKRRLDKAPQEETGDWDEWDFTQQDLETLDVMASQAIEEGGPSTSKQGSETGCRGTAEQHSPAVTNIAEDQQPGLFQVPTPGTTLQLRNRLSTSSSSDTSVYPHSSASFRKTPSSDLSSAPGSLTSSSSKSSGSLSMSSSEQTIFEMKGTASGMATQSGSASGVATGSSMTITLTALREDLRKKTDEAQRAQTDLYAKDGEVKYLKDALHKQEQELEKLREQRDARKDEEAQRQKEREKDLKQEVERLQTQVEFKTQDCLQLQQRCRTLESKLTQQQASLSPALAPPSTSTGGQTSSQGAVSPEKSPKIRKVEVRSAKTPEKGAFPSRQSFMSSTVHTPTQSVGTMTADIQQPASIQTQKDRSRLLTLNVPCSGGKTRGPHLVSQLLQCTCTSSGDLQDSGIVGLLQTLPSRVDLTELKYGRDNTTALLSPIRKARRSSCGTQQLEKTQTTDKHIIEREHFLQAVQGLRELIDSSTASRVKRVTSGEQTTPSTYPSGAVLLLPMLNDYLKHYLDIISHGEETQMSPNVSSSSNKSSSETGSSLESLSGSLSVLLQQGAEYANGVETLALCALRVLNKLVSECDNVRSVCVATRAEASALRPTAYTSSSTIETDHDRDKTDASGIEGDDEQSTTSSKGSSFNVSPADPVSSPVARLEDLNLLLKLLRLASPNQESSGFKASIVEAALDVLISLAMKLSDTDVSRLHVIIHRGVLTECLQLESHSGITVRALDLFCNLARSSYILPFFCTKSESCTLLNIHLVSTRFLASCRGKQDLQTLLLDIMSKVMDTVFAVVSFHRNGVNALTDNNCRCSGQIIPSLVHSMFYLARDYQVSQSDTVLCVLRKGVLVLHEMSLRDPSFQQRYSPVQSYYSILMSSLSRIYRSTSHLPQVEVSALEDLWEEIDDSDTGSQDSDHEENVPTE